MDEILENLQTVDEARLLRSKACLEKLAKIHEKDTRSTSEHSKALIAHSSLIDVSADITKFVNDTSAAYEESRLMQRMPRKESLDDHMDSLVVCVANTILTKTQMS